MAWGETNRNKGKRTSAWQRREPQRNDAKPRSANSGYGTWGYGKDRRATPEGSHWVGRTTDTGKKRNTYVEPMKNGWTYRRDERPAVTHAANARQWGRDRRVDRKVRRWNEKAAGEHYGLGAQAGDVARDVAQVGRAAGGVLGALGRAASRAWWG